MQLTYSCCCCLLIRTQWFTGNGNSNVVFTLSHSWKLVCRMSENQTICFCAHASKILVMCKQGGLNKEMDNVSNITVSLSRFDNLCVHWVHHWQSICWLCNLSNLTSAVKRSIGFTTGCTITEKAPILGPSSARLKAAITTYHGCWPHPMVCCLA